mmetsp:Transcript_36141/g.62307  ORF Transcript_36141/g.62307 Transcript_36141/m.62307 type:complete len:245 (-) Transcript_36141:823-1557(-)
MAVTGVRRRCVHRAILTLVVNHQHLLGGQRAHDVLSRHLGLILVRTGRRGGIQQVIGTLGRLGETLGRKEGYFDVHAACVGVLGGVREQAEHVFLQPNLVGDHVRADVHRWVVQTELHIGLGRDHAVNGHGEHFSEVHGLIARNKFHALGGLRVVDAAVDRHGHEAIGAVHVLQARQEVLVCATKSCHRLIGPLEIRILNESGPLSQHVRHALNPAQERRQRRFQVVRDVANHRAQFQGLCLHS